MDAPDKTTEIAQINVARLLHPWGDARVSGFTNALIVLKNSVLGPER
ncbi:MAG: hypothetical protein GKR99_11330 [Rhodobacteraceae bacterium]|nr:hypothetical protein [Paracoccaceae bacterium]